MKNIFEDKIVKSPEDPAIWIEYETYLMRENDARGKILSLKRNKIKNKDEENEYYSLISNTNPLWVAQFETFGALFQNFVEIEVSIPLYGSAPKQYGDRVYRVGNDKNFLRRNGWIEVGEGRGYSYLKSPNEDLKLKRYGQVTLKILVPSLEDILYIAENNRRESNKEKRIWKLFGPWVVNYTPKGLKSSELYHVMSVIKGVVDKEKKLIDTMYTKERFNFGGFGEPYSVTIEWDDSETPIIKEYKR